jgi:hypothetical protein
MLLYICGRVFVCVRTYLVESLDGGTSCIERKFATRDLRLRFLCGLQIMLCCEITQILFGLTCAEDSSSTGIYLSRWICGGKWIRPQATSPFSYLFAIRSQATSRLCLEYRAHCRTAVGRFRSLVLAIFDSELRLLALNSFSCRMRPI